MTDETREQIALDAAHWWARNDGPTEDPDGLSEDSYIDGTINQHPISYEAGRKAERNDVIDEALKIVRVTSIAWVKDERDFEMIRTIKEKLEALKTEKQ